MNLFRFSILGLLAPACLSAGADVDDQPAGDRPAHRAEDFVESMGLSASPFDRYLSEGRWKGAGTRYPSEFFFDLGIRYYRTGLRHDLTPEDLPARVEEGWVRTGSRPLLLVDPGKSGTLKNGRDIPEDGDFSRLLADLRRFAPGSVAGIEGPNELNNKFPPQELNLRYKGKTDEAAGADYQRDLHAALKADPATRNIPLIMFTAIFSDLKLARSCDAFDFLNTHPYQGSGVPSSSLLMNFGRTVNILPPGATLKPFHPTECGYNVEEDKTNQQGFTGSHRAQAYNIPMLFAEYFRHGIGRAYLFALHNADGYGLLESDQATKRPSWYAVQSFVRLLSDATWNTAARRWDGGRDFAPRALRFDIETAPSTVHTLTLQKQSGDWFLLVWNEVENFHKGANTLPKSVHATFRFAPGTPVTCVGVFQQGEIPETVDGSEDLARKGAFAPVSETPVIRDGVLSLAVPSRVLVLQLRTADAKPSSDPLVAPSALIGEATENSATLRVKLPQEHGAESVLLFREGRHVATLPASGDLVFEDRSAWILPGLGYRYAAQSVAADGRLSPRIETVVVTPDRRPDLVVGDFGPDSAGDGTGILPGGFVRFSGTVCNAGNGATPRPAPANVGMWNRAVALTLAVDGKTVCWGGDGGQVPMDAGTERRFGLTGGPGGWSAVAGTHVLGVVADDINRIASESRKDNNVASRTLTIGQYPGMLQMESRPAPGRVDLTAEGGEDWVCFSRWDDKGTLSRKRGANRIGGVAKLGEGYVAVNPGCAVQLVWSDGDGVEATERSHAGLWCNGVGNGYTFSVPADKTERVLRVYVSGINGVRLAFSAALSDDSAPSFTCESWDGNRARAWSAVPDAFSAVYTLRFRAAVDDARLTVACRLAGEPNRFLGQLRLQAATLSRP